MSTTLHDDDTHHLVRDRTALTAQQKLEALALTPPMVQAAALMYIMLANGEVATVPGGPGSPARPMMSPLLQTVRDYVNGIPFERFLQDGPPILSVKERLGVLVNTYDAMVMGGEPHDAERARFDKLTLAFGIKPEALESFRAAISAKNNRASLGKFDSTNLDVHAPTPHVALAAALVHSMMSPDGSIHPEDVNRLESVIGEYEGLLQFALNDAASVEPQRLFETMSKVLTGDQKLFVLTNVLDTMLKDGEVEAPERKSIFQSMRSAMGFTENAIKPFIAAIKVKCAKSAASHDRFGGSIMRGILANFEKKPIGFAKQAAEEAAAVAATNMQKVNRIAIPDQDPALISTDGAVISAAVTGETLEGISTGKPLGGTKPGVSSAHARSSNSGRAPKRHGMEPNIQQIQAQAKLTTARKQLESTRAVNAEILALLDQAQNPAAKPARHQKARTGPRNTPKAAMTSTKTRAVVQQMPTRLREAMGSLQASQRKAVSAALDQAVKQFQPMPALASKPKKGSSVAEFFDPNNLWRLLPPAAALAGLLAAPTLGYLLENVPARAVVPISCWLGVPFFKPMHTPYADVGCWASPRVRTATNRTIPSQVLGRPVEETFSEL